jgi:hypothetical protein
MRPLSSLKHIELVVATWQLRVSKLGTETLHTPSPIRQSRKLPIFSRLHPKTMGV